MTELQELRKIVQAQATRATVLRGAIEIEATKVHLLTRLVVRMGRDLDAHCGDTVHEASSATWPYTPIGQAEQDAAMHAAEGPPPDAVSEGAWGHE